MAERLRNTQAAAARVRARAEREQKSPELHYYRLLGVAPDAPVAAITKAYRQVAHACWRCTLFSGRVRGGSDVCRERSVRRGGL